MPNKLLTTLQQAIDAVEAARLKAKAVGTEGPDGENTGLEGSQNALRKG